MGVLLAVVGFLGIAVGTILAVISLFKKNGKVKKSVGVVVTSFILFIVGIAITPTDTQETSGNKAEEVTDNSDSKPKPKPKPKAKGIEIEIDNLPKSVTLSETSVTLNGIVKNAEELTVQGESIQLEDGKFTTTVDLAEGNNDIVLKAKNKHASKEVTLNVLRENPSITVSIEGNQVSKADSYIIKGNTEPNASIEVLKDNTVVGSVSSNDDGNFETSQLPTVEEGRHNYSLKVSKEGFKEIVKDMPIDRILSPEEIAQKKQATAKEIPFKELDKRADSLSGEYVKLTGKVVQLLEGDNATDIRLAVEKKSYGWDSGSIVYLVYSGLTDYYEDDVITVYGTVMGKHTYTSQAGWTISVPLVMVDSFGK